MDIRSIAEAISKHTFKEAYEHFAEDITWNLIGGKVLRGKDEVKKTCEESAEYLSTVTTTFTSFKTYVSENTVIIESSAEYVDEKNEKSVVASCDIYAFTNDKLQVITSYNIELPQTN
jgi:ketosteroid isomerase-like protein